MIVFKNNYHNDLVFKSGHKNTHSDFCHVIRPPPEFKDNVV